MSPEAQTRRANFMVDTTFDEHRVLLLPATRRDGDVISRLLERAQLRCYVCGDGRDLAARIVESVGVILLTDTVFQDPDIDRILSILRRQEPWSDIPSVLLCRTGYQSAIAETVTQSLRNVTVLDRPTPTRTLLSSLHAALRARARQYQMREQFVALQTSERAVKKASDALQDADRRKDEFLAMLAHELRNPLAPIQNATEILSRRYSDTQSRSIVSLLKRQTDQLSRLVDDLLDMSRITEGRIELRLAPVNIAAVVAQACESVAPLINDKHHSLTVEPGEQESLYVEGDYARLVQSVANLLTNAAKYTDPGGRIIVRASARDNEVAITVTDNGVGIAADLLPRIFDLFVQGQRSLDRSQGGLGIGLSVVKRLIEMHSGQISAQSAGPNQGSAFTITLPLIDTPATQTQTALFKVTSKKILVVDDNEDAANSLEEILKFDGHLVEVVYTGQGAIARAAALHPDVILLDVGLPDMSGYQVASQLRSALKNTQIIALTGYGQPDDVRRAKEAGFDAHVIKPVDVNALAKLIGNFHPRGPDRKDAPIIA